MFGERFEAKAAFEAPGSSHRFEPMPALSIRSIRERLNTVLEDLLQESNNATDEFDTVGNAQLQYPAVIDVPTWLGAEGPQMLALARDHADGVVFSAFSSVPYLQWAMSILNKINGIASVLYLHTSVHEDHDVAKKAARNVLLSAEFEPIFVIIDAQKWLLARR